MMNKTIIRLLFLALFSISTFNACTKKAAIDAVNNIISSSMSANIGSLVWTADAASGVSKAGVLVLTGAQTSGSTLNITMPSTITTGTYQFGIGTLYNLGYNKDQNTIYAASTGSLTITSFSNGLIEGTFTGTLSNATNAADIITISGGSFSVKM